MTAFHSSPRMLGQKQDKFWLTVGLCALTAALIFLPFYLLDGGFFHYAGDFNSQQISFYRYMNGFLKGAGYPAGYGGVKNTFSWATDLGSGTMNAYSFYLYGSPFFWFSLLFPQNWLPYLMVPLLVLKFAVAGGGAYLYLRRYVKDPNFAVLGAALYAFSGWGLYNIFFNHFIDVLALFPWMLWALDETIYERRHGWFAFWVAVNLLNNYFFFVGQVLFLVIYFVCKLSVGEFRLTPRLFGQLAFESLLGVALGFVVLWPTVLSVLQNPRTIDLSSGWGFLTYSKPQQYLAILLSWVLPPDSPYMTSIWSEGIIKWTSMTAYLPLCSLAGVVAYWRARQGDSKKRIVAVCMVFALVPILNSAFYALNSSYYARWFYMPVLLMCLATATALERRDIDYVRGVRWYAGGVLLFMVACGLTPSKTSEGEWKLGLMDEPIRFWLVCLIAVCCVALTLWIVRQLRRNPAFVRTAIALTAAVGCLHGMFFIGSGRLYGTSGSFLRERALAGYDSIAFPGEDEDEFFRLDLYNTLDNLGMYWHVPNIQAFHSIVPNSIMEFYPYVGVKRDVSSKPEVNNYALRPLLSVKYLAVSQSEKDAENLMPGYTFSFSQFGYDFYENENYLPMGFGYTTGVRQSVLDTAPLSLRANVMLEAVGLSDEAMERNADILTELESIDYASLNVSGMEEAVEERRQYTCDAFAFDKTGFTATCDLDEDVLMFFSVPYDSGWSATVNGEPVVIEKASVGFMAVRVPAGEAEIRFEYMTPGLIPGAFVSAGGLVLLGVYLLVMRRQDRRAAAADPVPASFRSA